MRVVDALEISFHASFEAFPEGKRGVEDRIIGRVFYLESGGTTPIFFKCGYIRAIPIIPISHLRVSSLRSPRLE